MRDRLGNINYKMTKAVDGKNLTRRVNKYGYDTTLKHPYSGRNIMG